MYIMSPQALKNSPSKMQIKINPVIIQTGTKPKMCLWFVVE